MEVAGSSLVGALLSADDERVVAAADELVGVEGTSAPPKMSKRDPPNHSRPNEVRPLSGTVVSKSRSMADACVLSATVAVETGDGGA